MRVLPILVSTLLALVNTLCFHGLWRTQRYLDDVSNSRVHLDDVWDSKEYLDDKWDNWHSRYHLDDVWHSHEHFDDKWDNWHSRYHLDDVSHSHEHFDGTWNSLEHDSEEYRSDSNEERLFGGFQRCFASVQRGERSRWRDFHYVYLVNEPKTYHDARDYCEERDGNLLKIDGYKDKKKIIRLLRSTCGRDGDYWIGLNKLDEDGRGGRGYYWDLDHSFPTRTYWWNGADRSYDCVAMVQEGNFQWSDRNCKQKMYFICEYDHRR